MPTGHGRDPDLEAAGAVAGPEEDPDAQVTDELLPEERLVEFEPPDEPRPEVADPRTGDDEAATETLDDRVRQEQPDDQ